MATITFTKSETKDNQFEFTYEGTKHEREVEVHGIMEPHYTGRDIEHVLSFGYTCDQLSEIVEVEDYMGESKATSTFQEIENEIYAAFYNQVKL